MKVKKAALLLHGVKPLPVATSPGCTFSVRFEAERIR